MNAQRLVSRLVELCSIAGVSRKEKRVSDYLQAFANDRLPLGLEYMVFPRETIPQGGDTANILMRVKGFKSPILLSAHMDTVPLNGADSVRIVQEDGIIRSDGSTILGSDDRCGISLALEMIDICLGDVQRTFGLEVLFTVQEELGCLGTRSLDASLFDSRFGYNLDGETPPGSLIVSAPQKARFTCTIKGKSSHAALAPEQGCNAIIVASKIVVSLPQGRLDTETTMNIGMIQGGGQTNIVPDHVSFVGEVRSFSLVRFQQLKEKIDSSCHTVAHAEGAEVLVEWEHVYHGYHVTPEGPCVTNFAKACGRWGMEPVLLHSAGGGDSNNLNALGIENVVFGIGMHDIHTPRESLVIADFLQAAQLLESTVFPQDDGIA